MDADYIFDWRAYSHNEISSLVCDAIISLAGDKANRDGMGWMDIQESLEKLFGDFVEVIEDEDFGRTMVRVIKKGE